MRLESAEFRQYHCLVSPAFTGNREAYERLKVQAIFPKPFDLNELRTAVDHLAA